MSKSLNRRALLAGGGAAAIVVVGGGFAATKLLPFGAADTPDAAAEEYVRLLTEVRQDYINGRVEQHEGWIVSQHELDTLASRESGKREEGGAAAG
jgi:hypothetical protein